MKHNTCILLFAILLLTISGVTQAQTNDNAPLFMLINDRLWSWTIESDSPQPVTDRGSIFDLSLSPDGTRLAYMGFADLTIDALERTGGIGGGALPTDIWVLDIAGSDITHVAQQPPDASFFTDGVPDKAVSRSNPVWSPDGTRLAWTEQTYPDFVDQLVVYDFTSSSARIVASGLPPQAGVPAPIEFLWGMSGFVLRSTSMDAQANFSDSFLVYGAEGNLVSTIPVGSSEQFMIDYFLIEQDGQEFIAVLYNNYLWDRIDPLTGSIQPLTGAPEMYAVRAPDTSLSLALLLDANGELILRALYPDGTQAVEFYAGLFAEERITLSPAGDIVAFSDYLPESSRYEDVIHVWRDGQGANVPDVAANQIVSQVVWGPTAWRVREGQTSGLPIPDVVTCPGFAALRLVVGGLGRVVENLPPNNVRSEPTINSQRLGEIPGGGVFTVIGGPVCAGNYAWWQVDYNGLIGWTAEGEGQTYWLEPMS
jgi:hypothetical protein